MVITKLDLTKEYKTYYRTKKTPEMVEFDQAQFLTIEGKGAPGGKEFTAKVEALYPLAYGIKMPMKKMEEENLIENGLHHETYLSDPRRVPEEKMKTIL